VAAGPTAPFAYYVIELIGDALKATGVLKSSASVAAKREELQQYLEGVKDFQGISATYNMTAAGYFAGPGVLLHYVNGQVSLAPTT
jgi:ABC-type branched-subunit amino acid transport system substrate-binding protein